MNLRLATYNIHRGYGRDGRRDLDRILDVIHRLDAHVVALQEVEWRAEGSGEFLARVASETDYEIHSGPTMERPDGHYGNVLLSRLPAASIEKLDLSRPGREPRGAIVATLNAGDQPLLAAATHLGLNAAERRAQVEQLLATVGREIEHERPVVRVLLGDLNEWCTFSRAIRRLNRHFENGWSPATFPVHFPLFVLDRILVRPHSAVREVHVLNDPKTRRASDHLPLLARIELPEHGVSPGDERNVN